MKERAKEFWERGFEDLDKKRLNLSAFDFEQAIQMWITYLIGKKVGDWPKTHYFSILIKELANSYDNEEITKFYNENEIFFSDLEDAYFTSRYLPKQFSENHIKNIVKNCEKFLHLLEKAIGEKFA
ncbi:MAG: HEPN domain-containing protein [Candidatus Ratteibacteria bacterium]